MGWYNWNFPVFMVEVLGLTGSSKAVWRCNRLATSSLKVVCLPYAVVGHVQKLNLVCSVLSLPGLGWREIT